MIKTLHMRTVDIREISLIVWIQVSLSGAICKESWNGIIFTQRVILLYLTKVLISFF